MPQFRRVAGARVVHVVALDRLGQAVVGGVVDTAKRQRRAEVVAFRGVVIDDVENDLDARRVQGLHHRLELVHLARRGRPPPSSRVRGEEADRVVAPVVRQPLVGQALSLTNWCTGINSTAVIPSLVR